MKQSFCFSSITRWALWLALVAGFHLGAVPLPPDKAAPISARSGPSESLGLATFSGPGGWARKAKPDFVSFEFMQPKQGTWSVIGIYRNRPGSGDANQDFSAQWQEVIASKFQVSAPTEVQTSQHPAGYELTVGGAAVNSDGVPATAMLVVASGHGNVITAVFLTNTAATIAVFDRFIQGVTLAKPGATVALAAAPSAGAGASGPRPGELVGIWVQSSVGGPAMYDRINGSFEGYASGSGGFLELKANGEARMTSMMRNSGGCGMSIFSDGSGSWSANGSVLTINFTSGEGELDTCGKKRKTKAVKLGVDSIPYNLYTFQGRPAISLNPGTNAAKSYYKK